MENSRFLNPDALPFTLRTPLFPYPPPLLPPPPSYTLFYVVPLPPSYLYNIFYQPQQPQQQQQQHHLVAARLPQPPPPMVDNVQFATPPPPPAVITTCRNTRLGPPRAAKHGLTTPFRGGRFEREASSNSSSRRRSERFNNGDRRAYMRDQRSGDREVKHQVIPVKPHETKTSIMIKNIPYGYNREKLMMFLDDYCYWENEKAKNGEDRFVYAYDFVYLPFDFRTKKSRGFAFVNFTDPKAVWSFVERFHNKLWFFDGIPKTIEIACAKMQGKEALVDYFQRANFECDTDEFLPLCFNPARDGSGALGKQSIIGNRYGRRYRKHGAYNHIN